MEFCLCLDTHYLKSPTSNSPKGAVLINIAVAIYREDGFCVIDKVNDAQASPEVLPTLV